MADTYTIQFRRGMYADFDTSKIRPGEPVAILGNDPSVPSGKALYIAFAANDVRRLCSIEDISEMVNAGEFVGPQGPKGEKGDKGDPGEKGVDGTVAFESLTPEQKESLRGISIESASVDTDGNLTITFSDGDSEDVGNIMGPQGIPGSKGDKGVGIKKITDYYALSSSNTDKAFGQVWLTTPPTMTAEKKYLWHWQRTDYTDGSFHSTEKGVIGVYGEQGPKGDKGDKGPKGDNMSDEQAAQIEQNKTDIGSLKEDISNKITKFYASSQGETHLADSDNGKITDMMIYGRSEQKQYSGKNLLNYDAWKGLPITRGTAVFEKNSFTLTATENDCYTEPTPEQGFPDDAKIEISEGETVTLSWESSADTDGIIYIFPNGVTDGLVYTNNHDAKTLTYTATRGVKFITFRFGVAYAGNTISYKNIQIEKGSTATSFEPYTGGIPSPNPDYPQEIKSVVNPRVKVCGKNLLKVNESIFPFTKGGVTFTYDKLDGAIVMNGTTDEPMIPDILFTAFTDASKKYALSRKTANNSQFIVIGNVPSNDNFYSNSNATDILNGGKYSIKMYFDKAISFSNERFYIQLEEGSTATPYEPYHEQTVTLPYTLNAIPVSSGGNVTIDDQQYVSDYVDVERGKLVRMVGEFDTKVLTVFGISETNGVYRGYFSDSMLRNFVAGNSFRTKLFDGESTPNATRQYSVYMDKNNKGQWLNFICDSTYRETADLKSFIQNTGTVYGIFETSEEIDLTQEEITAFKALATYYPTTNISINSEQLDGYTVFNYPISMENGWNYVKQQIGDTRDYIYDMDARTQDTDLQAAEAYVNSEYAVALTELEV